MKKIENRTRGETANMATVPAGYPRPPRVTRHIRIRAGLYYIQHGLIAALIFTVTYDTEANSRMRTKMLNWLSVQY